MKERILRLCKRLDKFSFEDISTIADDVEESVLELLLSTLVKEKRLIKRDDIYFYIKQSRKQEVSTIKYFNREIIALVIRCFCLKIPADKACLLIGVSEQSAFKLYTHFRKLLYEKQKEELQKLHLLKPQKGRFRTFFDNQNACFYIYNNQVYVTDKYIHSATEKDFTKAEVKEFKKIYCYLSRIECHNKNQVNLYYKLAESLWRRGREFEELNVSLNKLIA